MTWQTPTLAELRRTNRDNLAAFLPGADANVPNAPMRVLSDQNAGGAHLNLLYLDWLAKNLLPDQAETVWLDRWADILFGGRKAATFAAGTIAVTGSAGTVLPAGSIFTSADAVQYQTGAAVNLSANASTPVAITALTQGAIGNRDAGTALSLSAAVGGVNAQASVLDLAGGADAESDDELRTRVLLRIRNPPMGGAKTDYEQWALSIAAVTRAWCSPLEMGVGTVTVRIMFDRLRASSNGFPTAVDLAIVQAYIDAVRPVCADVFVLAPIAYGLSIRILNLSTDTPSMRIAIEAAIRAMLAERAAPGATIYAAWVSAAISDVVGDGSFDLVFADAVMPSKGHMAVLSPGPGIFYT